MKQLTLSPDSELAAGLTGLSPNPGRGSDSFSLVKIWSVKKKQRVHEFRVPGQVHTVELRPDSETVVTADRVGNLGWMSTIRAWNIAEGTERKVGTRVGEIGELCFSSDGSRLAAVAKRGYFDNMAEPKETKIARASHTDTDSREFGGTVGHKKSHRVETMSRRGRKQRRFIGRKLP